MKMLMGGSASRSFSCSPISMSIWPRASWATVFTSTSALASEREMGSTFIWPSATVTRPGDAAEIRALPPAQRVKDEGDACRILGSLPEPGRRHRA